MDDKRMQDGILEFNAQIKKIGFLFVTFALITNFFPALYVSSVSGLFPTIGQLLALFGGAAAAFGVGYFVQPISFFPMVNMAGSFLVWICGNVGELRVPAATMAQKATNCEQGSPKAEIMSTIGICSSVFVSISMISFFTIVGVQVLQYAPEYISNGFRYILPAVLGAVYASLCGTNSVLGSIVFASSIGTALIFPRTGLPPGLFMLVNIIIAIIIARLYFLKVVKKA